jgi:hypothetical protein
VNYLVISQLNIYKYITALLFCLVVFISIPLEILSNNLEEFVSFDWFYILSIGGSVLFLSLIVLLSTILKTSKFNFISKTLFFLTIFILLADILTPLSIEELETGSESPTEPLRQIIIQAIMFITLVLLLILTPFRIVNKIALPITIGILLFEIFIGLNLFFSTKNNIQSQSSNEISTNFDGNVYHFVFDSYEGRSLILKRLKELNLEEDFNGFINFENARSNYVGTKASFPSFMSGTLFTGREKLSEWKNKAYELSIVNKLRQRGFRTTVYTIYPHTGNVYADSNNIMQSISPFFGLELWMLRIVPAGLRQEVFNDGAGFISRNWGSYFKVPSGDFRSYASYLQYKILMVEETARKDSGEYVFAHFNPPHGPYQLTREGIFVGRNTRLESLYLATNMMAGLIRMLKENGRFKQSLIIIQSDHGKQDNKKLLEKVSKINSENKVEIDISKRRFLFIDERTKALLLIKLPASSNDKLQTNSSLVHLLDLSKLIEYITGENRTLSKANMIQLIKRKEVPILSTFEDDQQKTINGKCVDTGKYEYYMLSEDNKWTTNSGCKLWELDMSLNVEDK